CLVRFRSLQAGHEGRRQDQHILRYPRISGA
ncbi:hypothetical protein BN1708_019363, partial [Verticillium longisporum]